MANSLPCKERSLARPGVKLSIADYSSAANGGKGQAGEGGKLRRATDHFTVLRPSPQRDDYTVDQALQEALVATVGPVPDRAPIGLYLRRPLSHVSSRLAYHTKSGLHCASESMRMMTEEEARAIAARKGTEIAWPAPEFPPLLYYAGRAVRREREGTRVKGTRRVVCLPGFCPHRTAGECKPDVVMQFRLLVGDNPDAVFTSTGWETAEQLRAGLGRLEELVGLGMWQIPGFVELPPPVRHVVELLIYQRLPLELRLERRTGRFTAAGGQIASRAKPVVVLWFNEASVGDAVQEIVEHWIAIAEAQAISLRQLTAAWQDQADKPLPEPAILTDGEAREFHWEDEAHDRPAEEFDWQHEAAVLMDELGLSPAEREAMVTEHGGFGPTLVEALEARQAAKRDEDRGPRQPQRLDLAAGTEGEHSLSGDFVAEEAGDE